jgi:hypothetical protein
VFENRGLKRIFERKKDEVTGGWRQLHNKELRNLYYSLNSIVVIKSRMMRWTGHVVHKAYKILVVKPERNRQLRRPRRRWESNIKIDLRGIRLEGVDWIHLTQVMDRSQDIVNTVMNLRVP